MKTEPRVSTSSVEKLSTLCEEKEHDSSETASIEKTLINDTPAKTPKHELNNNINNNNRKLLLTNQPSTSSLTSIEAAKDHIFFDPNSEPGSPCAKTPSTPSTPTTPTTDAWINTGTWRRRQFSKERTISLKEENEELGLENVIPYHRSPKALSDMISKREAFFKSEAPSTKFDPSLRERDGKAEKQDKPLTSKENGHGRFPGGRMPGSRLDPNKSLEGYVGFANLPNQVYRKSVKKGFEFTLMVVGESGLGKSTLINSLFLSDLYSAEYPGPSKRHNKTLQINPTQVLLREGGVQLKLNVVDTPGFGDAVDNSNCWEPVTNFIDSKFEEYLNAESKVNRKSSPDNRVQCCLYFIAPTGHGLKPLDIEFMKRLHDKVNIIPLIAKADTLTPEECRDFKKTILNEIEKNQIRIYEFPDVEDEEENGMLKKLKERVPFAVVGSNRVMEVNGKKVRGRQYPWGVVEVDNLQHNDFLALRDMLIRTHMQDLRDVTNNVHYENYRYKKLANVSATDGKVKDGSRKPQDTNTADSDPLTQMEEERKEHRQKMKKMEAEMEQVFEIKVKEKMQKLKDSETDLQRRAEQMKKSLEQQKAELEQKRIAFLEEKRLWESQNKGDENMTLKKNKKSLF